MAEKTTKTANEQKPETVKIIIESTETESGDVYLNLNGDGFLIQRDVEVEVPVALLKILDKSVIQTMRQNTKTEKMEPVQIKRFPYSVLR